MDTPFAVALVLLVLLLGAAFAFDGGDSAGGAKSRPPSAERPAPVTTIVKRVERIRGLRFRRPPTPVEVSPAEAQRDGLEEQRVEAARIALAA